MSTFFYHNYFENNSSIHLASAFADTTTANANKIRRRKRGLVIFGICNMEPEPFLKFSVADKRRS